MEAIARRAVGSRPRTMAPPAKRPAAAADPADKRRRLDGGPTASTSATPVRLPRVPRGDTKQRHSSRRRAVLPEISFDAGGPPTSDLTSPAHPQTVAAIVRELRERAHENGVHPTTVQSLAAPFADAGFAETTENLLDEGLASTLRVLRQIAGPEVGSGPRARDRGETQRVSHVLERDPPRNGRSAPAPAPALGRALTAPPGVGVRLRVAPSRRCREEACDKSDVGGGRCTSHGGGKRCAEPACDSGARKGGRCISHGGGARCVEPDCGKMAADARSSKCVSHGGGRRCGAEDCDRPRRKGSMCGVHAGINVKPLCVERSCRRKAIGEDGRCKTHGGKRVCREDGCANAAVSAKKGVCAKHAPRRRCAERGCVAPASTRGLCGEHGGARAKRRCEERDCDGAVVSGTKCVRHGGGGRCGAPGCDKRDAGGRRCVSHGGGKRCQSPGCPRGAVGGTHCVAHGGGKRCSVAGCSRVGKNGALCRAHGGGKPCGREGCDKFDAGSGFCRAHGGGKRCSVDGCDTPAKLRGLCQRHGGGSMCVVEGCERGAKVRNLCGEHGGSKKCTVPGCGKLDRGRGFCQKHGELVGVGAPTCAAPFCEKKAVSKTKRLCAEHGGGRRCVAPGCQKIARTELATCLMHAEAAPSETRA